eukprot:4562263-Alexandrium_andersonii.AAC.1
MAAGQPPAGPVAPGPITGQLDRKVKGCPALAVSAAIAQLERLSVRAGATWWRPNIPGSRAGPTLPSVRVAAAGRGVGRMGPAPPPPQDGAGDACMVEIPIGNGGPWSKHHWASSNCPNCWTTRSDHPRSPIGEPQKRR